MTISNIIKLNCQIIHVYNSCDRNEFAKLFDQVLAYKEDQVVNVFTQRRYLWNLIRPRDFYKMAAWYIIESTKDAEKFKHVDTLVHVILTTAHDDKIRRSFVWNILKHVPLLTIDTIQYASSEKIRNILTSDNAVYSDTYVAPFINEIHRLRGDCTAYQDLIALQCD